MGEFQTVSAFACFVAGFVLVALVLGVRERKRSRSALVARLQREFGRPSSKKISRERYEKIPQYFLHHCKDAAFQEENEGARFAVDDITWKDLDMDRVYAQMDSTLCACGEEVLYCLLRAPAMRAGDLPFSQAQLDYFAPAGGLQGPAPVDVSRRRGQGPVPAGLPQGQGAGPTAFTDAAGPPHEKERIRIQQILAGLGHAGRYSLYEDLDLADGLYGRGNLSHYLAAAAPFLAFLLMFVHTGFGVVALLAVLCVNIVTYFREKSRIAPAFQVFRYILRLLDCAQALEQAGCPAFLEETAKIPAILSAFGRFRRGSGFFLGSQGGSADPLGFLFEYVRILFHLDLIKFNSMLGQIQNRRAEIDALVTAIGRIDACISLASWRASLACWSVPVLEEAGEEDAAGAGQPFVFDAEDVYHPLLTDPVGNSLHASRPVLLTGSNASGKSTFLKAVALCALLAQATGIAPARSYRGSFYRIYTSMALRDSLLDGESYFIVEIKSLRRILQAGGEGGPVLCCIDEVLRGTNTVERIAASTEILRCFAGRHTFCLAATHDLELAVLLEGLYENMHFAETIADGDVRFSYRLQDGPSNTRNAIALLDMLGYDRSIVDRARARADAFRQTGYWA